MRRALLFQQVFNSVSGKQVLDILKTEFYDTELHPGPNLEFNCGCRSVVQDILTLVNYEDT